MIRPVCLLVPISLCKHILVQIVFSPRHLLLPAGIWLNLLVLDPFVVYQSGLDVHSMLMVHDRFVLLHSDGLTHVILEFLPRWLHLLRINRLLLSQLFKLLGLHQFLSILVLCIVCCTIESFLDEIFIIFHWWYGS